MSNYFKALADKCQALCTENTLLTEIISNIKFDEMSFYDNDEKVKYFTKIPSYAKNVLLLKYLNDHFISSSSDIISVVSFSIGENEAGLIKCIFIVSL